MTIALLSLAGVPPLAGFFGNFHLISSIVEAARLPGYGWLLVLPSAAKIAMLACVLLVLIGIYQGPSVRMATSVMATLGFQIPWRDPLCESAV